MVALQLKLPPLCKSSQSTQKSFAESLLRVLTMLTPNFPFQPVRLGPVRGVGVWPQKMAQVGATAVNVQLDTSASSASSPTHVPYYRPVGMTPGV